MSPPEPSVGDADTAQTVSRNHVVVTGAEFTRTRAAFGRFGFFDFGRDTWSVAMYRRLLSGAAWCVFDIILF